MDVNPLTFIVVLLSSLVAGLLAFTNGIKEQHEMDVKVVQEKLSDAETIEVEILPETVKSPVVPQLSGGNYDTDTTVA